LGKNSNAKKVAIYLLKENTDLKLNEIGKIFNLSYSGVSQVTRRLNKSKELEAEISQIKTVMLSNVKG
jgi:chromosomal replication initiation ATPase DnaA